jgi:N5-(cytidine 5'-diphosphoramidyl)-L-glutamine hydrolase
VPSRNERRDELDQAWAPFLAACGVDLIAVPNRIPDPAGYLCRLGVSGVVLTGGGNISTSLGTREGRPAEVPNATTDLAPERDITETELLRASIEQGWPVIGVCRGMQAMNLFHGGRISQLIGHSGTRHQLSGSQKEGESAFSFDGEVNSYHDYGVPADGVGAGLVVLAEAAGWPEAFVNYDLHHLGIMWHPERNQLWSIKDVAFFRQFLRGSY